MKKTGLNIKNYYQSSDLALATTLSLFFPIENIDKTNPHRAIFKFKRAIALDKVIEAYWKKEIKVTPQDFFQQLKVIKTRLYSHI